MIPTSKIIDRIMRISDDGYVASFKDIKEVLENFLNYTVGDLASVMSPEYKIPEFADDIVRKLGNIKPPDNSTDYTETLRISDLLCLMKHSENSEEDSDDILLSYMKNLSSYILSTAALPWVELFLHISLHWLTHFFALEFTDIEFSKIYWQVCLEIQDYKSFEMTERTTLKAILEGINGDMFASWNPGYYINEYTDRIKSCCRAVKLIFVDGVAAYCCERFNFSQLSKNINKKNTQSDRFIDVKDNSDYIFHN